MLSIAGDETVRQLLNDGIAKLTASDSARLDAELLLADALNKTRSYLYCHPEEAVKREAAKVFEQSICDRADGVPVAYLRGVSEFWSITLKVDERVLVPRPETETLVALALNNLPTHSTATVIDLGTGSGAIAIAIALERPNVQVLGIDLSDGAVDCALNNAKPLDLKNLEFMQSDWFTGLGGNRFDLVVTNPPYVAASDPLLTTTDIRHEPRIALESGEFGLDAILTLTASAPNYLKPGGSLLLEHGYQQGKAVRQRFAENGFMNISTHLDNNGLERVTLGRH